MRTLTPLLLLATASVPPDHPRHYLLSIVDLPLRNDESLMAFSFETWGVQFEAVCHIPSGWRIEAGSSATPNGTLAGKGSQGATWFNRPTPRELHGIVLITLSRPIQAHDVKIQDSKHQGVIPATFQGRATISTERTEREEDERPLSSNNIRLDAAQRCPS